MGEHTPPFEIPEHGGYIWEWFRELSLITTNVFDGLYRPIPPSEYLAWQQITGKIVYSWEYDILFSMDSTYCDEMNKEIQARQSIRQERAEREAQVNSRKRR